MKSEEFRPYLMRLTREQRVTFLAELTELVEKIDQEQAARAAKPVYRGFYSLLHLETRRTHIVEHDDLEAFCKTHKLNKDRMLKVAMGEEREYKGWRRGSNINALGKPYKPPREVDPSMEKEKEHTKKRQAFLDQNIYTLPPASTTVDFIPPESEN